MNFEQRKRLDTLGRMKANGIVVDHVSEVTDELVEVMAQLLAQLSSTAAALGRADLEEIVASPSSIFLVARLASRDDAIEIGRAHV